MSSMFGARFSSAVTALRGELSAVPQTATDTITKLVEKISTSPQVEDRRTAVQSLKGLSREYKAEVGREAFPSLIAVLVHDAPYDVDIAKASLETFMSLCEVPDKPAKDDVGLKHIDMFLETPEPFHAALSLLSTSPAFYVRFNAIQFISQIMTSRASLAQTYLLSAPPPGVDGILTVLDPKAPAPGTQSALGGGAGEILRNEGLLLLPVLLAQNADLQKIIAFSGAFEKVLDVINAENGIDGGIVVQDALAVIATLLQFNVSNQNLFRELSLIPSLPPILKFPAGLPSDAPAPDEFAIQEWQEQKILNAGLTIGLIRMLVGGPGGVNQSALANGGVTRCLLELALASNAPNALKSQALNALTPILLSSIANQALLSTLEISPLLPVRADAEHPNGGFIRLPPQPVVEVLVSAVINGDPSAGGRGLRGRAAGVNLFEAYVSGNDDARIGILSSLVAPPSDNPNAAHHDEPQSAGSLILSGLLDFPSGEVAIDPYRPLFSCLLMAHLLRNSEGGKKLAREVSFPSGDAEPGSTDEDDKVSLLQLVVGNLMMAARAQETAANQAVKNGGTATIEEEDWTRVMVGYLVLLCTWLWDSPKSVKEFLSESSNLQVVIGPITQPTGIDPLVQGLCAFLLGVCYEFNREPGEVTRATLHPILHSRIGPDQFVSRMARLREDPRFRAVQPDAFDTESDEATAPTDTDDDEGLELWFDWAFVDFWKNNYYTVQRSIAVDPDVVRQANATDDGSSAEIIMNLRRKLKASTEEVVGLQAQITNLQSEHTKEKDHLAAEIQSLGEQVSKADGSELDNLRSDLAAAKAQVSVSLAESAAHAETKAQLAAATAELEQLRGELREAKKELGQAKGGGDEKVAAAEKAREEAEAKLKTAEEKAEEKLKEVEERLKKAEEETAAKIKKAEEETEAKLQKAEEDAAAKVKKVEEEAKTKVEAAEKKAEEAKSSGGGGGGGGKGKKGKQADNAELTKLKEKVEELEKVAKEEKEKASEAEKEHEDLLVLLDELTSKRKRDKKLLREKGAEVSEDEDDDEEEEE